MTIKPDAAEAIESLSRDLAAAKDRIAELTATLSTLVSAVRFGDEADVPLDVAMDTASDFLEKS